MRTLPLLDELEAALASGNIPRRIDILTRIADLFVNGAEHYSEDQVDVFDDVMARLVNTIETKARAKLAVRLAPISNAPSDVIHMLAFDDDIEVARPVLTNRSGSTSATFWSAPAPKASICSPSRNASR